MSLIGTGRPFIYNTRANQGEDPNIFIANEGYGNSPLVAKYSPSPGHPCGNNDLGTYGFYSDMGNPDIQEWWGKQYEYLLSIGIDMIWQDMTCPALVPNFDNNYPDKTLPLDLMMYDTRTGSYEPNAKIHNNFAINLIKATYDGISKLKNSDAFIGTYNYKKRNFIIARGGYAGVHRYAGIWTGDSASSWDFLQINIPEVLNIGLSGQPISGCDIGGFANGSGSVGGGVTEYELFTRWMTCGAFLPWYRNHYDKYTKDFQEPYNYGEPVPTNCRKYIETRYRLIQVFYDAMYQNTINGLPIARALFVNDPFDPQVYQHCDDQFFLGNDILVAPVVTNGTYSRPVYLPTGSQWYVFNDNTTVLSDTTPGGTTQQWNVPLDLVPVYVREGAIIPLRELEQWIGELKINPVTLQIYPGKNSTYTMYQDDETTTAAEASGAYRLTEISHEGILNGQRITINRTYDKFTPNEPYYFVALPGTAPPTSITLQGTSLTGFSSKDQLVDSQSNGFFYDGNLKITWVMVMDTDSSVTLEATF
ncbi:MAG: TIM-barrel domain-containing protein [Lewinella sp.]